MQNQKPKYKSKMLVEQREYFQVWLYEYADHCTVYVVPRSKDEQAVVVKIGFKWATLTSGIKGILSNEDVAVLKKS